MNRRQFVALAALPLTGCPLSFEQGLRGECRAEAFTAEEQRWLTRAFDGVRADRVWDVHAHLFGNGRTKSGVFVESEFDRPRTPVKYARKFFFANGGCLGSDEDRFDTAMVARIGALADQLPLGAKVMLLAFDFTHDERGTRRPDLTTFAVTNEYAQRIAATRPNRFEWIASVHPYRADAIEALESARRGGARAVKWLPPAMNIDLSNPRCRPFYEALARLDLPLLVHVGEEQAVAGAERHDLANPLFLRFPLDAGARVIAAHCASLGKSPDLDAAGKPEVENFVLFERLMAHKPYEGRLFGEISAITQANRNAALPRILAHADWDARLLNGTDYPLPGIMPLFSLKAMVSAGLLDEAVVPVLRSLREKNALAFDFVLKRNLHTPGGRRLPAAVFETRAVFERGRP